MDLPPFHHQHQHHHHHHPRYVPPPPPNFSDNSNFYQNQHHRLPQPPHPLPPLPPPPPPPQRLSHPPPPLPSPSQSQFTFRAPLLDEKRSPQISNFMSSHRLNLQKPQPHPPSPPRVVSHYHHHNRRDVDLFDDNSRFSVPWSDLPTLPRIPPERQFLHQNHHGPVSPFRPHYQSNSHDFDGSSRFRAEFSGEGLRDDVNPKLPLWRRKDMDFDGHDDLNEHIYNYRGGRAGYGLNFDRIDRDFAFTDLRSNNIPSRNFEFNGVYHESYNEDSKKDSRWGYSCLGKDSVYPTGVLVHSRESSERGRYDTGVRFNNSRAGEGAEELISQSPRKKPVQKKSALLRIQLGKVNNSRNRSRDHSHFLKGYYNESSSSGGAGSFKGKEKDVFPYSDSKMKGEREKSPVELDVSFKSNALVAKAIMATSSPVVDSNRNLTPRDRKLRKLRLSDSPGIKLCEDFIGTESSTDCRSGFDKDHGQLKDKVISDTTDRSKVGLASPFGLDKDRKELKENDSPVKNDSSAHGLGFPVDSDKDQMEAVEKVITFETDSCISGMDCPSGTEKNRGQLAKKTRVSASVDASNSGSPLCLSGAHAAGESSASKESPKSVSSARGSEGVASSGTIEQSARKRKRDIIPFQRESDLPSKTGACVLINQDNLCKDTPKFIQLDESIKGSGERTASVGTSFMYTVAAESVVDDDTDEKLKNGSQLLVTNSRKDNAIDSSHHLLPQSLLLMSVSSNSRHTGVCEGADNSERSRQYGYSGLNFESQNQSVVSGDHDPDDAHKHPSQNEQMPFENSFGGEIMDSIDSCLGISSTKQDKIHDGQVDACICNNGVCSASSSDQQFCRSESIITVFSVASKNGSTEESIPTNETIKDSDDEIFFVDSNCNLSSSKMKKTIDHEGSTIQDCSNVFSSATPCSGNGFPDSLGLRTISESFLSDDTSRQTLDAATRLPESRPLERPSNAKMSGVDSFIDHCVVVHSPRIKRQREVVNDHLHVYDNNTSEIGDGTVCNTHYKDASVRCLQNFVPIDKEVVPCRGDLISRDSLDKGAKCSLDNGPSGVHLTMEGKKRKVSIPRLASPVLSETCHGPKGANSSTISENVPLDIEELTAQSECRISLSGPYDILLSSLKACPEPSPVGAVVGKTHQVGSLGDGSIPESSKLEHVTSCLSKQVADCKEKASVVLSTDSRQISTTMDKMLPYGDGDSKNYMPAKENMPSLSSNLALSADVDCVSFKSSDYRPIGTVPNASLNRSGVEEVLSIVGSDAQNNESRPSERANGHIRKDDVLSKKPVSGCDMSDSPKTSSFKSDTKEGDTVGLDLPLSANTESPLSHNAMKVTPNPNPFLEKSRNKHQKASFVRGFPGQTSVKYPSTRKASPLNRRTQPRTWHRTGTLSTSVAGSKFHGNHVASQIHSQKEFGKVQNSYIRKGNSLVRNPSPVGVISQGLHVPLSSSICRLNPVVDNAEKGRGSRSGSESVDPPNSTTQGGIISGPERPKTPPLIGSVKMLSCTPPIPEATSSPPSASSPNNDHPSETFDHSVSAENMDTCSKDGLKPSGVNECQTGSSNNLDLWSTLDERNSEKKIIYVKRKSNQLVAASNSGDLSLEGVEKTQALSSDAYYKRSKNQLIRTPLDDEVKKSAIIPLKSLNSQGKEAQKDTQSKTSSKRQSGFSKRKSSLVWTLRGALSSKKDGSWGRSHRAQPYIFPWKRATYWRNVTLGLSPAFPISRRLLLSQKRDTIYKRSVSGFSLRRLKVFSVGGRSLKWSKSLERKSRKANEDATLAIVAAEKVERQQNGAAFNPFKSRNYVPRERVFRIGSERYRMDPTRKTLQRISDEKPSYSDEQSEMSSKKFYVPRRLLIGNDEYIRIGNGNKLVRDPKKRTRVLANEKVRWSLHTARLRLARKKKYCQFFTRFGKCNKDDRKCPYVHDPSKIAVCTKFLNGSCSNANCKLTHKVVPERMQDCSYFLRGLCSNESCPYRHVNVNPNSPICEGFLRGYCADGNECWKKHTYVCPVFEATGNCQQGDKCRLHHPERKKKGTKRKTLSMKKNARGRYFGVGPVDIANGRTSVSKIISEKGDDNIFCQDGKFVDYISLDVSDEAIQEVEPRVDPSCDSEGPSDVLEPDLDELIKPIRIMKRSLNLDLSPALDS